MKRPTTTAPAAPTARGAAVDLAAPSDPAAPPARPTAAADAARDAAPAHAVRLGAPPADAAPGAATRPRADAVRNRERILVAARELFVEFGPGAAFDEVARRAGVGNATLYRHFPDRPTLVRHVVLFVMDRVTGHAERALAEEADAFDALCRFTHAAADERIGALCPMLAADFGHDHPELLAARDVLEAAVQALLTAGQDAALVRPDIGVGDLMVALSQLSRPLPGTACIDVNHFTHRHLQLFLDGLRAPARSVLPGSAPTAETLRRKTM
ncbi:TetR/AcrR family transcriptional regulator [Streptomyces sp. NPDC055254]